MINATVGHIPMKSSPVTVVVVLVVAPEWGQETQA